MRPGIGTRIDDELLEYIHSTSPSALNEESGQLFSLTASELRSRTTELSESSLSFLKEMATKVFDVPETTFVNVDILVVPSFRFYAEAIEKEGKLVVVLHRGLQYCLSFTVEVDLLCRKLHDLALPDNLKKRAGEEIAALGEEVFLSYIANPCPLPKLRRFLASEDDLRFEASILGTTELFVILHEVGHVQLGHLDASNKKPRVTSSQFLVAEHNSQMKEQELEADRFAIECCSRQARHVMAMHAVSFLRKLAIFEAFLSGDNREHPYAINRMNVIITRAADALDSTLSKSLVEGTLEDHDFGLNYRTFHRRYISSLDPLESIRKLMNLLGAVFPMADSRSPIGRS